MKKFPILFITLWFTQQSIASGVNLPQHLSDELRTNVAACSYQLLLNTKNLPFKINKEDFAPLYVKVDVATPASIAAAASTAAAASYLSARLSTNDDKHFFGAVSLGLTAGASVAGGVAANKEYEELTTPYVLNNDEINKVAEQNTKIISEILHLSPLKQKSLKSSFIKVIADKLKSKDTSPINLFEFLKSAKYGDQNLLSARDIAVMQHLEDNAKNINSEIKIEPERQWAYLQACTKSLQKIKEFPNFEIEETTVQVIRESNDFLNTLEAYVKLHPEKPKQPKNGGVGSHDGSVGPHEDDEPENEPGK